MLCLHRRLLPVFFYLVATITVLLIAADCYALAEDITFTARDGYRIAATLTRPEKPVPATTGVVLIHMYRSSREGWNPLIPSLSTRGITSLAIDLRGHGASRIAPDGTDGGTKVLNRDSEFFNAMYLDAEAALEYLEKTLGIPPERTALVGASVGCSIAIRTAIDRPVAGVVVMTPGREYLGIPTMEQIQKWPGIPLLILTSEEESERGADDIYAALQNRGAEIMVFKEENIHGTHMFGKVKDVEKIIAEWLSSVFNNAPDRL